MSKLKIISDDAWLEPYQKAIEGRHNFAIEKEKELTSDKNSISDFANGYLYYGLHKVDNQWIFREWAPNATAIYLIGDFNHWQKDEAYSLSPVGNGVWEKCFEEKMFNHRDLYKLLVEWNGGAGERIPAWARRVVQDDNTKIFSAQVWLPEQSFSFKIKNFKPAATPLLIYECHIGMATNEEKVGTCNEFRQNVLPKIKSLGYNCIQIMAIQEHPYYGSFGYHVSSFFAASSRFGTPEELKQLIDEAHSLGIAVIMDIVHSHAVKNEVEGLGMFDGTPYQYFHTGKRREHQAWNSLCFNYAKNEVLHFLLSNCKFWLDEYRFDGFRFDGVTSMIYLNHGLEINFGSYDDYYNANQDGDAICYLTLANRLIHQVNPHAITIAEEVSGLPELATKFEDGGMAFDYRMAMGIPDFWIKYIKEVADECWQVGHIYWEVTNRRSSEKTVSYAESHDQALVGDKTIIFRLIDADMYWHMHKDDQNLTVARGVALHKMIRLITATTINGGYLNFMGNEFGHPEWIDFPRDGNHWSYKYAKRQWQLSDNQELLYSHLNSFDRAMIGLINSQKKFNELSLEKVWDNESDQVLVYQRKNLLFVFNFNPNSSFVDYGILVKKGSYKVALNTDAQEFGGFGLSDDNIIHFTQKSHIKNKEWLKLYIPSRSAVVLRWEN
ncbi:MAG: alpha amylase C-terminal domain-containing protein [Prevotellaceae bacterium]|jgi:1,4-alpha-glucan branching enzyme|nr:alpha amylase C-terminal domain-containing protein [Prevotellaceae bacterium]